jgi:hypothetical protein
MKKNFRHTWVAALIATVLSAAPAFAQGTPTTSDPFAPTPTEETPAVVETSSGSGTLPAGTWGLGVVQTISGIRGPEFEYHLSKLLIAAMAGFAIYSPEGGDSQSMIAFGGAVFYPLLGGHDVGLFIGGRAIMGFVDTGDSGVNFYLEAPLRAQWYVNNHLSLHLEVGLTLAIIGDAGDPANAMPSGTNFGIGNTNLVNTAGATIYF